MQSPLVQLFWFTVGKKEGREWLKGKRGGNFIGGEF